jgi:CheY-like chemotaxis protein
VVGGKRRVLIVDDEPDIRMLVVSSLRHSDEFEVVAEAANGHQAIEAATTHQPDVILLDIAMPELNGIAALATIKAVSPGSLVIVLTAYPAETRAEQAFTQGADAYMEKSDLINEMIPALRAALESHGRSLR